MLFVKPIIKSEELNTVQNIIDEFDGVNPQGVNLQEESEETSCLSQYLNSYVTGYYQKSVEDIENTKVGNKVTRKRNLTQIMRESFFYGANRFGNNFIA